MKAFSDGISLYTNSYVCNGLEWPQQWITLLGLCILYLVYPWRCSAEFRTMLWDKNMNDNSLGHIFFIFSLATDRIELRRMNEYFSVINQYFVHNIRRLFVGNRLLQQNKNISKKNHASVYFDISRYISIKVINKIINSLNFQNS